MNLSISSFKNILIILSTTFVLILAYSILVARLDPQVHLVQNQEQANILVGLNYLTSAEQYDVVILGSSMSVKIDPKFLNMKAFNLSFRGSGPNTGLEIIKSNQPAKYVLIESDTIFKGANIKILNSLFTIQNRLAKYIPALNFKYQPLNIILSYLHSNHGSKKIEKKSASTVLKAVTEENLKEFETTIPSNTLENNLESFRASIDQLAARGTTPIFYRMPIDERFKNTKRYIQLFEAINKKFSKYYWLPDFQSDYEMTDGIHVSERDTITLSKEFASTLNFRLGKAI